MIPAGMTNEEHYAIERERQERKREDFKITARARRLLIAAGNNADRVALEAAAESDTLISVADRPAAVDRAMLLQQDPNYQGRRLDPETVREQVIRRSREETEKIREYVRKVRELDPKASGSAVRRQAERAFETKIPEGSWYVTYWNESTKPTAQNGTHTGSLAQPETARVTPKPTAPRAPAPKSAAETINEIVAVLPKPAACDTRERDVLVAALRNYAGHLGDCRADFEGEDCDCGWVLVLELLGKESEDDADLRDATLSAANELGMPFWDVEVNVRG